MLGGCATSKRRETQRNPPRKACRASSNSTPESSIRIHNPWQTFGSSRRWPCHSQRRFQWEASLLKERDHVIRIPRCPHASSQDPSKTQLRIEATLARKRRRVLTKIIPVRTRTPMKMKKRKEKRSKHFATTAGMQPEHDAVGKCCGDATAGSSCNLRKPHEGLDVKCLRKQIEQMHFVTHNECWPRNSLRFPG